MRIKKILLLNIPLTIYLLLILFPFLWNLSNSLKLPGNILKRPIQYLPSPATFENYKNIWENMGFSIYFKNSLIVSSCTLVLLIIFSLLGGYALSRYRFKGKTAVLLVFLLTQMLPGVVLIIPLHKIFNAIGLINSLSSLIITNTVIQLPFCTIMMSGFFSNIPPQLEEAAMVDGCTLVGAIFRIILPTIAPGLVATGAFGFVGAWNDFIYALAFINNNKLFTLPIGLSFMQGEFSVDYGGIAAGSIIALIPVLLLFGYIQKYLVSGLAAGSVKG